MKIDKNTIAKCIGFGLLIIFTVIGVYCGVSAFQNIVYQSNDPVSGNAVLHFIMSPIIMFYGIVLGVIEFLLCMIVPSLYWIVYAIVHRVNKRKCNKEIK